MYMSGRALYPLTVSLALRIAEAFDGSFRSPIPRRGIRDDRQQFSAGSADHAGDGPSKARRLSAARAHGKCSPRALCRGKRRLGPGAPALAAMRWRGSSAASRKSRSRPGSCSGKCRFWTASGALPGACPIGQDIPAYLRLAEEGNYSEALRVIWERNPLPHITAHLSPFLHEPLQPRVLRGPVDIRQVNLTPRWRREGSCSAG
jgi:putative selenate reductase